MASSNIVLQSLSAKFANVSQMRQLLTLKTLAPCSYLTIIYYWPHVTYTCVPSGVKTHLGNLRPNSLLIRIRSSYHQAIIARKPLISTILWLLYDFLSVNNDVNVPSKSNKQKKIFCLHWRSLTKSACRIRICTKMPRSGIPHITFIYIICKYTVHECRVRKKGA